MITYRKMSLFDAPLGSILVHACNGQGVWGSGIAAEFYKQFPESFDKYREFCEHLYEYRTPAVGHSLLLQEGDFHVGCIITSQDFGQHKDDKEAIKIHTAIALMDFLKLVHNKFVIDDQGITIFSNKFNSGLFGVPWKETEFVLKTVLKAYHRKINWVVCDPNLGD